MKMFNSEAFQGSFRKKNYFEGWYNKLVAPDGRTTLAAIPGISLGSDSHAFVQINTSLGASWYCRYPLDQAELSPRDYRVRIGKNLFSPQGMSLDLSTPDGTPIQGQVTYRSRIPYPKSLYRPGIMGPYSYVPAMECNHGLVSAGHDLEGSIQYGNAALDFTGGRGYIEKDWGRSFPSSWIWLQANNFSTDPQASFMLSIARIPWMGSSFTGLLGYLYTENRFYHLGSYLGSRILHLEILPQDIRIQIRTRSRLLEVHAHRDDGQELAAPVQGSMVRTIKESVAAHLSVALTDTARGCSLFPRDESTAAGLEVSGSMAELGAEEKMP